jgi:hypothetical protein
MQGVQCQDISGNPTLVTLFDNHTLSLLAALSWHHFSYYRMNCFRTLLATYLSHLLLSCNTSRKDYTMYAISVLYCKLLP